MGLFFSLNPKCNLKLLHKNNRWVNNCSSSASHNLPIDFLLYLMRSAAKSSARIAIPKHSKTASQKPQKSQNSALLWLIFNSSIFYSKFWIADITHTFFMSPGTWTFSNSYPMLCCLWYGTLKKSWNTMGLSWGHRSKCPLATSELCSRACKQAHPWVPKFAFYLQYFSCFSMSWSAYRLLSKPGTFTSQEFSEA